MTCECGHTGNKYLVTIEVCPECEPDREKALFKLSSEEQVISLRIDNAGSIWIGFPGLPKTSYLQPKSYNAAMSVSSLAHILSDRFSRDITNIVFILRMKES